MEPWRIVRMLLSPEPIDGGGGGDGGEDLDVTDDPPDEGDGDTAKTAPAPKPEPKPKAAPKSKPAPKPKATVSATELEALRTKAQAYDAEEAKRTLANERVQREREAELAKTDPVKAVETVRKRLETIIRAKDQQIAELTGRTNDLTGRLHSGVLDTGLKEAIAEAADAAKLKLKAGAVPFMLKDLRDRFEVDESESGEYFIFEKESNREVGEVVAEMFKGSYKEFFASQADTPPAPAGGGNRRQSSGGGNPQQKSYAASFKRMVDGQNMEGVKPSVGLTRPKAS